MKRGGWDENYKHTCPESNKTLVVCALGGMERREELKGPACHVAVSKVEVHPGCNEGLICVQAVYCILYYSTCPCTTFNTSVYYTGIIVAGNCYLQDGCSPS